MLATGLSSESPTPRRFITPFLLVISSAGIGLPHAAQVVMGCLLSALCAEQSVNWFSRFSNIK
jgi:hypothetical protein